MLGCRCVEIDVWNGSKGKKHISTACWPHTFQLSSTLLHMDLPFLTQSLNIYDFIGEPKVTHGRTGSGWIPLRDVLEEAIKPYAFRVSPYPVESNLCIFII